MPVYDLCHEFVRFYLIVLSGEIKSYVNLRES